MPDLFVNPKNISKETLPAVSSEPVHMLSAFCENPIGIAFAEQASDEKILLFLRRHFITNLLWILISVVLLLFPILFFIFRSELQFLGTINLPLRFTQYSCRSITFRYFRMLL